MAELAEASSSAFSSGSSNFEVFLNFRGEDTRNNFTGFLHKSLKDSGINVFFDSEKLWTGEAIGKSLLRAIEGSKISIPVFSKGYASSKWCLLELSQMIHCHGSNNQMVLPIFFDVEPSHVRNQTGSFQGPFQEHEKNFEPHVVESWRTALRVVGNLKGWVLKEDTNGDQVELVDLVVKRVMGELISSTHLAGCEHPIGIDSSINDVLSLLNIGSNDVQFLGICGFGGIGKTTIAKAVYNSILKTFNRHSFLSDVRGQAVQCMGLASLQRRLLKDIFKMDIDIADVHRGKKMMEQRLCKEKVLIVLDDVDSQEQVDALAGNPNWFGQGSRVIITTRNEYILTMTKDKIYKPRVLDHEQSLQLFSWHAFQNDQPPEDFMQLSRDVAHYSKGLPLTLEVLGSYLGNISNKEEWRSTLQTLKEIPHEKVQRRLQISYDNLENDYQKAIFLDAACFFIGWEKETVISIWEACGYHPNSAIYRLIRRSLLKFEDEIDGHSYLRMHDQIRDMGRKIVLEESLMEPGKRSRLWSYEDIVEVLEGHKGTSMIKGMSLNYASRRVILDGEPFQMMLNLRFLDISSANFVGDISYLPSALRCFRWRSCRWQMIPTNFYHDRLVYLDLSQSYIEQAWNLEPQGGNKFKKLKFLNLSHSRSLSKSPDFSWFPYLERLDLGNCRSLHVLDESIGQLGQLKFLILQFCGSLKELPDGVGLLEKLEVLDAKYCFGLKKLPRSMGRMKCLDSIYLEGARISELPDDFSMLWNLVELKMSGRLHSLPTDLSNFKKLKQLEFYECENLKYLPDLPSRLVELHCEGCDSLVQLPDLSRLKNLRILCLKGCIKLEEIRGLEGTDSLEELDARECYNLTHSQRKIHGWGTLLPDMSLDKSFPLIAHDGADNNGLILCIVFEFLSQCKHGRSGTIYLCVSASIRRKDKLIRCFHTLRIDGIVFTTDRDIIYMHRFEGFDWFGIPLQGEDAIEILDIYEPRTFCKVKFWKLLFDEREPDQKRSTQHWNDILWNAILVSEFFDWLSFETPVDDTEEEEEILRPSTRPRLHDKNDEAAGPSLKPELRPFVNN